MTEAKTECRENHRSPIVPQTHPVMEGARVVEKWCSSWREHDGPTVWICAYANQTHCMQYALSVSSQYALDPWVACFLSGVDNMSADVTCEVYDPM